MTLYRQLQDMIKPEESLPDMKHSLPQPAKCNGPVGPHLSTKHMENFA